MKIVALAGGVGGAKLVDGFAQVLAPSELTVIVNTGDDFEHFGLYISPDLDTVCYTLAGLANPQTGWGLREETFRVLEEIKKIDGPVWFGLGDRDLATHLERTRRLRAGESLIQVTQAFCNSWGVRHQVLPMSNAPVRTMVDTFEYGELPFQEYFVLHTCEPKVKGFRFSGIGSALPAPGVIEAIREADAVVICPSNPWVSIDPILGLPGLRSELSVKKVVAVSPIIQGRTIKGPAAKMYSELGIQPSALAVANHYGSLLAGFVLDEQDASLLKDLTTHGLLTNTIMTTPSQRRQLAKVVLNFIKLL